jgi:hypothetical protein
MRCVCLVVLSIGFVALAESPLFAQPGGRGSGDQEAGKNGWVFSLEDGIAQAEKSGKPLMVVFRCVP